MIGKPEWFGRRKYSGWGVIPKTWQGWVYLVAILVPIAAIQYLPFLTSQARTIALLVWAAVVGIDVIDIMIRLRKDERETMHEAIAERNAAWFMVIALAIGLAFDTARAMVLTGKATLNPIIAIALFGGVLVKAITNFYLDRKG